MNFELWKAVYWLVGTAGVAGTIAFFAFAPTAAAIVGKAIVRFFSIVFSYRIGCAVVAATLAWFIADFVRHSSDDARYAAEVAEFEKAQDARDKRIKEETTADVWREIANATAENVVTDTAVKDFTDALPKPPETGNPFRIGDDAMRLCKIAGETQCGHIGGEGVPKAHAPGGGTQKRH